MRKAAKMPPVRTWSEPVDSTTFAVCATCYKVRIRRAWIDHPRKPDGSYAGGCYGTVRALHGISLFLLLDVAEHGGRFGYRAHQTAREVVTRIWIEKNGQLPFICRLDDADPT